MLIRRVLVLMTVASLGAGAVAVQAQPDDPPATAAAKKKKKKRKVIAATFTGTELGGGVAVEVKTSRGKTATVEIEPKINCEPRGQSPTQIPATVTGKATRLRGGPYKRGEYYRGPSKVTASMGSWTEGQFGGEVRRGKTFVGSVSYQDSTGTCRGDFTQFELKRTKVRYGRR